MRQGDQERSSLEPIRVVLYDATDGFSPRRPGLSPVWALGARLYRGVGHATHRAAATGLDHALAWFRRLPEDTRVAEVQWWSHGNWGNARLGSQRLDERALLRGSKHAPDLDALARRLSPDSLLWLRTCESFGARAGQRFAHALASRLGCRVAGHTYVIGFWQSGLHSLLPGASPSWPADEGVARGSPEAPKRAHISMPFSPYTIHCLNGAIPEGW